MSAPWAIRPGATNAWQGVEHGEENLLLEGVSAIGEQHPNLVRRRLVRGVSRSGADGSQANKNKCGQHNRLHSIAPYLSRKKTAGQTSSDTRNPKPTIPKLFFL